MIGLLQVAAVAALVAGLAAWAAVAVQALRSTPLRTDDDLLRLRLWLYAPVWLPPVAVAAALLPTALGGTDHCLSLAEHRHHLCLVHPPHLADGGWWVLLAGAALALWGPARTAVRLWREQRWVRALIASSRPGPDGIRLLDLPEPLAFTAGLRRPVILLSTGLQEQASADTLRAVVAHEAAHVQRRDPAWAALDRLVASLWPRAIRARLIGRLQLVQEVACDAQATSVVGRLPLAQALTEVLRLQLRPAPAGLSVGSSAVELRVAALLRGPAPPRRAVWGWAAVGVLGLIAWLAHDALEWLVAGVLH